MSSPIVDGQSFKSQAAAIAAEQGAIAVQNIADVMSLVDDQGVATAIGTGVGGVSSAVAGTGIAVSAATGAVTFTNTDYQPKQGTALTNADQTLAAGTDKVSEYVQAVALTANRVKTLSTTSAITGQLLRIVRTDTAAFTLTITNGGANGGSFVFAASPTERQSVTLQFNGVDWVNPVFEYLRAA